LAGLPRCATWVRETADILGAPIPALAAPRTPSSPVAIPGEPPILSLDRHTLAGMGEGEVRFLLGRALTHLARNHLALLDLPEEKDPFVAESLEALAFASRWIRTPVIGPLIPRLARPSSLPWAVRLGPLISRRVRLASLWSVALDRHSLETAMGVGLPDHIQSTDITCLRLALERIADRGGLVACGDPLTAFRALILESVPDPTLATEILNRGLGWGLDHMDRAAAFRVRSLLAYARTGAFVKLLERRFGLGRIEAQLGAAP